MKSTRIIAILSVAAFLVLGIAAILMGAINQDEGWYIYAANLVSEGNVPYRDFFYTQGPLMPIVYSSFTWVWQLWGLAGARTMTLILGFAGIVIASALAYRLANDDNKCEAATAVFALLGCNLYHLYFLAIPKTYALAGLFVIVGFYFVAISMSNKRWLMFFAGLALAFAAGTRISLGALLAVIGLWSLVRRDVRAALFFALGGFIGLGLVYGPFLLDEGARSGLFAAQAYHASRGGADAVWTIGSLSRLVRWYLPIFVVISMGGFTRAYLAAIGFAVVFLIQMLAPFPYEDYQVPLMALLAVFAAVNMKSSRGLYLAFVMTCACSFGSPLLEKWMTNGQDRFWSLKKEKTELRQLQDMAAVIESLDPGGKELLTQDLYLAVETGRRVPRGLEMGPFAMLSNEEWKSLLDVAPCKIAALSGYSFAIQPPVCNERPIEEQIDFWSILRNHYDVVFREEYFGQNATTLLVLKRKGE